MDPIVHLMQTSQAPVAPEGMCPYFTNGPDGTTNTSESPVLIFGGYTFWTFKFDDNRYAFGMGAYDADWHLVTEFERRGVRYIKSITVDPANRLVIFWGQGQQAKHEMSFDELIW